MTCGALDALLVHSLENRDEDGCYTPDAPAGSDFDEISVSVTRHLSVVLATDKTARSPVCITARPPLILGAVFARCRRPEGRLHRHPARDGGGKAAGRRLRIPREVQLTVMRCGKNHGTIPAPGGFTVCGNRNRAEGRQGWDVCRMEFLDCTSACCSAWESRPA